MKTNIKLGEIKTSPNDVDQGAMLNYMIGMLYGVIMLNETEPTLTTEEMANELVKGVNRAEAYGMSQIGNK